jgi:hypothetical protein
MPEFGCARRIVAGFTRSPTTFKRTVLKSEVEMVYPLESEKTSGWIFLETKLPG